jgi:hypothetical protein
VLCLWLPPAAGERLSPERSHEANAIPDKSQAAVEAVRGAFATKAADQPKADAAAPDGHPIGFVDEQGSDPMATPCAVNHQGGDFPVVRHALDVVAKAKRHQANNVVTN